MSPQGIHSHQGFACAKYGPKIKSIRRCEGECGLRRGPNYDQTSTVSSRVCHAVDPHKRQIISYNPSNGRIIAIIRTRKTQKPTASRQTYGVRHGGAPLRARNACRPRKRCSSLARLCVRGRRVVLLCSIASVRWYIIRMACWSPHWLR